MWLGHEILFALVYRCGGPVPRVQTATLCWTATADSGVTLDDPRLRPQAFPTAAEDHPKPGDESDGQSRTRPFSRSAMSDANPAGPTKPPSSSSISPRDSSLSSPTATRWTGTATSSPPTDAQSSTTARSTASTTSSRTALTAASALIPRHSGWC